MICDFMQISCWCSDTEVHYVYVRILKVSSGLSSLVLRGMVISIKTSKISWAQKIARQFRPALGIAEALFIY